jgi:outer membrane lipoprotein SlyB
VPITYAPIIDKKRVDLNKYQTDLDECREYAKKVHDDTVAQGIVMAILGAGVGAAVGSQYDMTGQGASYGATLGAASGSINGQIDYQSETKKVIDNCLIGRGYKVLGRE